MTEDWLATPLELHEAENERRARRTLRDIYKSNGESIVNAAVIALTASATFRQASHDVHTV